MQIIKTIRIPMSHVNAWLSHPGWWAVFEDPGLSPSERFAFDLSHTPQQGIIYADCVRVRRVTAADIMETGLSLAGWFRVEYRPDPAAETADWGDAGLLPDGTHDSIGQGRRVREAEERLSQIT